jgi:iron(III) transport system substrate-binding protein
MSRPARFARLFRPPSAVASALGVVLLLESGGCAPERREIVVYCALDQEHAASILEEFEKQTGIHVSPRFDDEITKTVGLTKSILLEKDHPRADVFWNNEVVQSIRLQTAGCLEAYASPSASDIPAEWKDPGNCWTGFAARARILIVNKEKTPADKLPRSYKDLADPARKGQAAIAKPVAGTTSTHLCALYELLGADAAQAWFDAAVANGCGILAGNGPVMREVRDGRYAWGFTDTDDFHVAELDGYPVQAVYPDQGDGEIGCLVIPNTISLVKGAPHAADAKRFIDFVLTKDVERRLAFGPSAQIPVRPDVETPPNVRRITDIRRMKVDFAKAAAWFEKLPTSFGAQAAPSGKPPK